MSARLDTNIGGLPTVRSIRPSARAIASVLITMVVIGAWFVFLRPPFLGGPTSYVLVSGESMEPTLHDDDFVIARRQATYEKGDIAAYRVPEGNAGAGSLVIHRIIGGSAQDGYMLQGDNRSTPDLWRPRSSDIVGTPLVTIPRAGKVIPYLRSPFIMAAFAGYMAFLFVYLGGKEPETSEEDPAA